MIGGFALKLNLGDIRILKVNDDILNSECTQNINTKRVRINFNILNANLLGKIDLIFFCSSFRLKSKTTVDLLCSVDPLWIGSWFMYLSDLDSRSAWT